MIFNKNFKNKKIELEIENSQFYGIEKSTEETSFSYTIEDAKKTFESYKEKEAKQRVIFLEDNLKELKNVIKHGGIYFNTNIYLSLDLKPYGVVDENGFETYIGYRYHFSRDIKDYLDKPTIIKLKDNTQKKLVDTCIKYFYDEFIKRGFNIELKKDDFREDLAQLVLSGWWEEKDE